MRNKLNIQVEYCSIRQYYMPLDNQEDDHIEDQFRIVHIIYNYHGNSMTFGLFVHHVLQNQNLQRKLRVITLIWKIQPDAWWQF